MLLICVLKEILATSIQYSLFLVQQETVESSFLFIFSALPVAYIVFLEYHARFWTVKFSCTGVGWDRDSFPHTDSFGAVCGICGENTIDNTPMSQLWQSGAYKEPVRRLGVHQELERGHSQDSWPNLTKGMSHAMWNHGQQ